MAEDEESRKDKIEFKTDLARRIRHWRGVSGLKPVHLARALEMSEASVSRWENAGAMPSASTVGDIAKVCGVSLNVFWGPIPEEVA